MDREKLTQEILRGMLQTTFEKMGEGILKKNPGFTTDQMKAEARRLTSIYLENFDPETHTFDMEIIRRMTGMDFSD